MQCIHKLHLPGRSRSALYNNFTTPRPLTAVHHTIDNNLKSTTFSYTFCTDLHISSKQYPNTALRLFVHKLYLSWRSRSALYNTCTATRPPMAVQHTVCNNLQPMAISYTCCTDLYSFPKYYPNSALRFCVHKLYLPGRSCSALYNSCTTPRPITAVQHTIDNNLKPTTFLYTCLLYRYV